MLVIKIRQYLKLNIKYEKIDDYTSIINIIKNLYIKYFYRVGQNYVPCIELTSKIYIFQFLSLHYIRTYVSKMRKKIANVFFI